MGGGGEKGGNVVLLPNFYKFLKIVSVLKYLIFNKNFKLFEMNFKLTKYFLS